MALSWDSQRRNPSPTVPAQGHYSICQGVGELCVYVTVLSSCALGIAPSTLRTNFLVLARSQERARLNARPRASSSLTKDPLADSPTPGAP